MSCLVVELDHVYSRQRQPTLSSTNTLTNTLLTYQLSISHPATDILAASWSSVS